MAVMLNLKQDDIVSPGILAAMEDIARIALSENGLPRETEISLTLCSDEEIHQLNKQWRSVDAPTDVLSFPLLEADEVEADPDEEILLGDIVISLDRAAAQAQDFGHSLERELLYLFAHGVLHLLGYDHLEETEQVEMRSVEESLLSAVGALRHEL